MFQRKGSETGNKHEKITGFTFTKNFQFDKYRLQQETRLDLHGVCRLQNAPDIVRSSYTNKGKS